MFNHIAKSNNQIFGKSAGKCVQAAAHLGKETHLTRINSRVLKVASGLGIASMLFASTISTAATSAAAAAPSWCGPKKITMALTDGFGGNSWRLVTTASAQAEAAKCPSVKKLYYADGQGNTSKAISDIKGFVAKGVNAIVVFPDAGKAILPALRAAYKAGVVTVPYRVFPGGVAGKDYTAFIGTPFAQAGQNWANWALKALPKGGNVLFLSGPAGNSQGTDEAAGFWGVLKNHPEFKPIGVQPFEVTNWDPALAQQVLTADIAANPKIDLILSDFGPTLVGALTAAQKTGWKIPAIAASDGNVLGCFWKSMQSVDAFPMMTVSTQNDHARLAIDYAVAKATGGKLPGTVYPSLPFEDSISGKPNPVQCASNLPGDVYLSAQLSGSAQAALGKK